MGIVVFMTLPGLVIVLIGVAFVDRVLASWRGGGRGGGVSATGFEMLHASLLPGKEHEIQQRETQTLLRDEEGDGAPGRLRVDLAGGRAVIRQGPECPPGRSGPPAPRPGAGEPTGPGTP